MLRKLFIATLLLGQIVLFAAGSGKRADGGEPEPGCLPCQVR